MHSLANSHTIRDAVTEDPVVLFATAGTYTMTNVQGTAVASQKMRLVFSATMVLQEEDMDSV